MQPNVHLPCSSRGYLGLHWEAEGFYLKARSHPLSVHVWRHTAHRMSNSRLWRLKHTAQTVLSSSEVAELRSTSLFFIHLFFLLTSAKTHFYLQPFWGRDCWVSTGTALSFAVGMNLWVKIVTVSQMFWWHRDVKKNTCSAHFLPCTVFWDIHGFTEKTE